MTKTFLDCGGNAALSVNWFLKNYPRANEYNIISIEPNPQFKISYEPFKDRVQYIPHACGLSMEYIDFFIGKSTFCSGTDMNKDLQRLGYSKISVLQLDLIELIQNNITGTSNIIKMDIEGKEFEIIKALLNTSELDKFNTFYIDFHYFLTDKSKIDNQVEKDFLKYLDKRNLKNKHWEVWDEYHHQHGFKDRVEL